MSSQPFKIFIIDEQRFFNLLLFFFFLNFRIRVRTNIFSFFCVFFFFFFGSAVIGLEIFFFSSFVSYSAIGLSFPFCFVFVLSIHSKQVYFHQHRSSHLYFRHIELKPTKKNNNNKTSSLPFTKPHSSMQMNFPFHQNPPRISYSFERLFVCLFSILFIRFLLWQQQQQSAKINRDIRDLFIVRCK